MASSREHRDSQQQIVFANPTLSIDDLHTDLLDWYSGHKRRYPWRKTRNAFHILLSEMMLRRTRADQVVDTYVRFIEAYPNPELLALATIETLQKELYSLGLAWRIPAFKDLARALVAKHSGNVPDNYSDLVSLPGVGDYVASAVCCFAFGQPRAVIDVNTVRVAGRIFAIPVHAESRRRKPIRQLILGMLDEKHPRQYNYALLDLAAQVCTAKDPDCAHCPLLQYCRTGQGNLNEHRTRF